MPGNKRKAAPPLPKKVKKTTTAATPKNHTRYSQHNSCGADHDGEVGAVVTKTGASNREAETAVSGRDAAPSKLVPDFLPTDGPEEDEEEGGTGGWGEFHAKEAKTKRGRKASVSRKVSINKAAEKVIKKAKLDAGTVEEESGGVRITAVAQKPIKAKPKKPSHSSGDESSLHREGVGNVPVASAQNSESESEDEYDEGDDQTSTLLRGFESDEEVDSSIAPLKKRDFRNLTVPGIKQRIASRTTNSASSPGYIFLGRIPHGFYEREMRSYFSQFGDVLRLRLSRSKKTGRSKHYAFLEFASSEVAEIVAATMDNYLLYGHILKCKVIPRSEIKDVEALFKGAGKRFKRIPWTDIMRRQLDKKRTVAEWAKLESREEMRRKKRNRKLKELGFDYQSPVPT